MIFICSPSIGHIGNNLSLPCWNSTNISLQEFCDWELMIAVYYRTLFLLPYSPFIYLFYYCWCCCCIIYDLEYRNRFT